MLISKLTLFHKLKSSSNTACSFEINAQRKIFQINTCQRDLWILPSSCSLFVPPEEQMDFLSGADAYEFLLRVACGLESAIIGETDVFGQIKKSWREFEKKAPDEAAALRPWIQKLFEDTKWIRKEFIQGLGGKSYGSLVRKILPLKAGEKILIVGAGQLARSMVPYFLENPLVLWNRTPENLKNFQESLQKDCDQNKTHPSIQWVFGEEDWIWQEPVHAIICVPLDSDRDMLRTKLWAQAHGPSSTVVHLGCYQSEAGPWKELSSFYALNDLFELQENQQVLRSLQLARAKRACRERAIERTHQILQIQNTRLRVSVG